MLSIPQFVKSYSQRLPHLSQEKWRQAQRIPTVSHNLLPLLWNTTAQLTKMFKGSQMCNLPEYQSLFGATPRWITVAEISSNCSFWRRGSSCRIHPSKFFRSVQVCAATPIKFPGKSCAKIILVHIYHKYHIDLATKAYAVIDDQTNSRLGTPELFDRLEIEGEEIPYVLSSCNGNIQTSGRRAHT